MLEKEAPVLIIGAGLAGLSCAIHLQKAGIPFRIFEASDDVGGRVRTDEVDGFLLDRGFQVYLDAYEEAGSLLNLEALKLQPFEPGALVYRGKRLHRVMDVFRRPASAISSAIAPVGTFLDKLRIAHLRWHILSKSTESIAESEEISTEIYLRRFGFSEKIIDCFFRSFYGGIFLENDLRTNSRMFEFTFQRFAKGRATLPAKGMGEIPKQLAAQLPGDSITLNSPVRSVSDNTITLVDGTIHTGQAVVIATDSSTARRLNGDSDMPNEKWRSVTNVYYSSSRSPLSEPIIALNGSGQGRVNNICVLNDVSPNYAPDGQHLISASLLGLHTDEDLPAQVKEELRFWFETDISDWQHLRTDLIERALPGQGPGDMPAHSIKSSGNLIICGDHCHSASIEGAILSGKAAAHAVMNH